MSAGRGRPSLTGACLHPSSRLAPPLAAGGDQSIGEVFSHRQPTQPTGIKPNGHCGDCHIFTQAVRPVTNVLDTHKNISELWYLRNGFQKNKVRFELLWVHCELPCVLTEILYAQIPNLKWRIGIDSSWERTIRANDECPTY